MPSGHFAIYTTLTKVTVFFHLSGQQERLERAQVCAVVNDALVLWIAALVTAPLNL